MTGLVELAIVVSSLALVYGLLPWRVISSTMSAGWPRVLMGSIVAGAGSQAVFGMIWSRFIGAEPRAEFLVYLTFWLLVNLAVTFRRSPRSAVGARIDRREGAALAAILGLALTVRSIHPLQHMALGQSDAYTHLNYLRDVLQFGVLHNLTYPPGFSWVLALPTWLARIDPYFTCRFAGAFFGASLVLALYVFMRRPVGEKAALATAFLAACFPGFNLLIKTGVGVFANQFGIFLIPVVLHFALESGRENFSPSSASLWLLVLSLASLAVAVPMMLIHLTWVLLLAGVFALTAPGAQLPRPGLPMLLFILPALALVILHFSQLGDSAMFETLKAVTSGGGVHLGEPGRGEGAGLAGRIGKYLPYVEDYFTFKRAGLGSVPLNLAAAGLGAGFLTGLAAGFFMRDSFLRLLGTWGLLGVIHVSFGFLQFSAYQREGWSLLVATSCLMGMAVAAVGSLLSFRRLDLLSYGAAALIAAAAIARPPGHVFLLSEAEEEIVRLIRQVHREGMADGLRLEGSVEGDGEAALSACGSGGRRTAIVTRQFIQYGLVQALIGHQGPYLPLEVRQKTKLKKLFNKKRCYLVILERTGLPDPSQLGILSSVNAPIVKQFSHLLGTYYETHDRLVSALPRSDRAGWRTVMVESNPKLEVRLIFFAPRQENAPVGKEKG